MSNNFRRNCLNVSGFNKDIDRRTLLIEFRKFGDIKKLYLDPSGEFARVFFLDGQSAETAFVALQNSILNWQVSLQESSENSRTSSGMAHYNDNYEDDDFCENFDYCNIHGQPLVVLQADSGDLYVNLKDVRKTGFALFRRDTFDSVLVDNRQIGKEFELHLLSEAKNYILKNRVACIDEDQILKTIERCKNKLLGGNTDNSFGSGRSVSQSSRNIMITSSAQQSSVQKPIYDANPSMVPESVQQRPPKTLPNNFLPTQVQRGDRPRAPNTQNQQQSNKGRRDNSRYNGVKTSNSSPKTEDSFNSSSSSETRDKSFNKGPRGPKDRKDDMTKVAFEIKNTYDVTVSYKEEKENICWVQDKSYTDKLEQVIFEVNTIADSLQPISPVSGQLVIAAYDGVWNRGRVYSTEPLIVSFIDYGNKGAVDLVKPLPDSLKAIPILANRIAIDFNGNNQVVKEEMDLTIFIKQKYDKGTYVVNIVDNKNQKVNKEPLPSTSNERGPNIPKKTSDELVEKPSTSEEHIEAPKPKSYFVIPEPLTELQDGDMIMLVDVEANKFLVRTRECAVKSKTLTDYIKNLDKTPLTSVKVGQLVLCSKDGYAGLFRAVVAKRDNDLIVSVKYIDFPGDADLSVKSLRNVDEFIATEPATILVTPEYKYLEDLNEEAGEYVSTICQNKEKFKMVLSKGNFDLQATDGTLLSQKLESFKAPEPVPVEVPAAKPTISEKPAKTETVAEVKPADVKEEKIFYDVMDWIKIDPGTYSLLCYCLQDIDDITFLSSSDDVISHLETITSVNPTDKDPYEPEASEMCLVLYKGPEDIEATWYRAVVLSVEDNEYTINFVDFGNIETAKSEEIRRFPAYLKDVPILGIGCSCTGLPKKPQILERLKELIPEGTQVEVVVKYLDDLKYQVELPEIYKQLKEEKLF